MPRKPEIEPILNTALEEFALQTGIQAQIERPNKRKQELDATLTLKGGQADVRLKVEVKPWLNMAIIGLMKERIQGAENEWLLVTNRVGPVQAERLRELNIAFVDTQGNAFINLPGLHIFVKGQKKEVEQERNVAEMFRPAQLRVLFGLLCIQGLEAKTHREIREKTGAAYGTINRLFKGLKDGGYLLQLAGKPRRLVNKTELVDQWVAAYPKRLRPKILIGTYDAREHLWWKTIDVAQYDAEWGGEVGAEILTQYLKPEIVTLYLAKERPDLLVHHRLTKKTRGNVRMFRKFWNFTGERMDVVPPLLVYADLIETGIDRNIETASIIRKKLIDRPY